MMNMKHMISFHPIRKRDFEIVKMLGHFERTAIMTQTGNSFPDTTLDNNRWRPVGMITKNLKGWPTTDASGVPVKFIILI